MKYVLVRISDGAFVADMRHSVSSYTRDLVRARIYGTKAAAMRDCCPENERIVAVDDLLKIA